MRNESVLLLLSLLFLPIMAIFLIRWVAGKPVPLSYNIRSIRMRWQVTVLTVCGIALVVMVFMALLSMLQGFYSALRGTGSTQNAIIIQRGSPAELTSALTRPQVQLLSQSAQIVRAGGGRPLVSPERVLMASLPRRGDGQPISISFRGVTPMAFEVRTNIQMKEGRRLNPGQNEIIVGERLLTRVSQLGVGSKVHIAQRDWAVVGIFTAGGGAFESELWGDADLLGSVYHREENFQSLTLRLASPNAFSALVEETSHNPQLQVQVTMEQKYYEDLAGPTAKMLRSLAGFVAFILGIGAIFAAMNTMYGLIAVRTREIGILRALGFTNRSVLYSLLLESVGIALLGGVVGCLAVLPVHGISTGTGQTASFSEIAFAFQLTPALLAIGLGLASFLGAAGGLLPALRAARLPLTAALRATG